MITMRPSRLASTWFLAGLLALLLFNTGESAQGADLSEGRRLYQSGAYWECLETATSAIEQTPWIESWWKLKIDSQRAVGQYSGALLTVENGLKRFTTSIQLRWLGHEIYQRNGLPQKALEMLASIEQLANQAPWRYSDATNRVILGRFFLLSGADPRQVLELAYDRAKKDQPQLADSWIASGELALDKQDYPLAAKSFETALKLVKDDPQIHYLLARALASSDPKRATQSLEQALKLNPLHVPSHILKVDHFIDSEQYEQARLELRQVLGINIRHSTAWAYQAVLAHLENDLDSEQLWCQASRQWNIDAADSDHLIGRKLSQKYRFEEGAHYQRLALQANPGHVRAQAQLSQDLLRLGREEEGWQLAQKVNQQDPYNIVAHNLVTLQGKLAKFTSLEENGILLRMDARESQIYGPRAMRLLQRARQTLCTKYAMEIQEPVIVEIFPDQKDFAIRTFGLPGGAGFLGVCFGKVITANSPASQGAHPSNWEAVLWHEFCHVVTLQKTRNKMPRWLSEGISVYEERQANSSWGQSMDAQYRKTILAGGLTPISQLSGAFLQPPSPMHLQFAYYQSSLVVEYLVERYGMKVLLRILDDLGAGLPINQSLQRYSGSLPLLEKEFEQFARQQAEKLAPSLDWSDPDFPDRPGLQQVQQWLQQHPRSYLALRLHAQLLMRDKQWEAALQPLDLLFKAFPEDISGGSAYELLAQVHRQLDQPKQEQAILEQWIQRDNDALNAQLRLLEIYASQQSWPALATVAEQTLAVNPLLTRPHQQLSAAATALQKPLQAIPALLSLLALDPRDPADIHYRLASSYHETNQPARARRHVLQALEYAPRYRDAHRLLLKLGPAAPPADQQPQEKP
ncbi:MAG: tetratricopeptide repeat protein [Pirellulaceae bacterium]